jgi:hypothetical protein
MLIAETLKIGKYSSPLHKLALFSNYMRKRCGDVYKQPLCMKKSN